MHWSYCSLALSHPCDSCLSAWYFFYEMNWSQQQAAGSLELIKKMYPYPSELFHWHWGNHGISPVLIKWPWNTYMKSTSMHGVQWHHNGHDGVSNHQPHHCLLNYLFRCRSKKTSKLCITGLCQWNSLVTGEFPAQRASNVQNVSIWWFHHGMIFLYVQNILNAWFANNQFELMLICVFSAWMSSHYLPFEYDCVLMGCHLSFWCQIPVKWHDCLMFCQCVPLIIWIPFGIMIHQLNMITVILANGRKSSAWFCSIFYWTWTLWSNI